MESNQSKLIITFILALACIAVESATLDSDSFLKPLPTDPWFNLTLPLEPRPGYFSFLGECIDKTTRPCCTQVFDAIFKKILVNDSSCCRKIIGANYICNRSFSFILGQFDKFKNNATLISQQSNIIYHHCLTVPMPSEKEISGGYI